MSYLSKHITFSALVRKDKRKEAIVSRKNTEHHKARKLNQVKTLGTLVHDKYMYMYT